MSHHMQVTSKCQLVHKKQNLARQQMLVKCVVNRTISEGHPPHWAIETKTFWVHFLAVLRWKQHSVLSLADCSASCWWAVCSDAALKWSSLNHKLLLKCELCSQKIRWIVRCDTRAGCKVAWIDGRGSSCTDVISFSAASLIQRDLIIQPKQSPLPTLRRVPLDTCMRIFLS